MTARYAPLWLQANPGHPLRLPRVGLLAPEDEAAVNAVIHDSADNSGGMTPSHGSAQPPAAAPATLFASPSSARRDSLTGRAAAPGELQAVARGCSPIDGRSHSTHTRGGARAAVREAASRPASNSLPHEHSGEMVAKPGKGHARSRTGGARTRDDPLVDRLLEPARVERQRSVEHRTSWAHLQTLALRDGARSVLEALNVIRGDKVRALWHGGEGCGMLRLCGVLTRA